MAFKNFFYKKDLDNQLDFFKTFKPQKKLSPYRWFFLSGVAVLNLVIILFSIQSKQNTKLKTLINNNQILACENKTLEEKASQIKTLKTTNNEIREKLKNIDKIKNYTNNYLNTLISISESIPENSWLVDVKLLSSNNQNKDNKNTKMRLLEIEGFAPNEKEIIAFKQNLSQRPELINIKLAKLQKIKNHLNFKLTGDIKAQIKEQIQN